MSNLDSMESRRQRLDTLLLKLGDQAAATSCCPLPLSRKRSRPNSNHPSSCAPSLKKVKATSPQQDENECHPLKAESREHLVNLLLARVDRAKAQGRLNPSISTMTLARRLETTLFRASPSLKEHLNTSNLDQRLNRLVQTLQDKQKKQQSKQQAVTPRATTAQQQKRRAQKAVRQAEFYRFSWANQTKCGMAMPWMLRGTFPEPVKKLFFQTKLLTTSCCEEHQRLDALIVEAETNLQAYQEWACQHLLPLSESCPLQQQKGASCPLKAKPTCEDTAACDAASSCSWSSACE